MSRYLRTLQKINGINQKVILQVESCRDCPLMKFHQNSCIATCRVFKSEQGNIVDDFVLDYDVNTGKVHAEIDIPNWCALAEFKDQLDFDNKTYTVHNDRLLTSENAIIDRHLPVYLAHEINKSPKDMLPAIIVANAFRKTNELSADEAYEIAYSEYEHYEDEYEHTYVPPVVKYEVCSLCGDEHESVSRNINHGMCDSCWEKSHDNGGNKKQAFLNNFRIKRDVSYEKKIFNHSVLKVDNHKVIIKT